MIRVLRAVGSPPRRAPLTPRTQLACATKAWQGAPKSPNFVIKYANGIVGSEKFLPAEFATAPEIKIPDGAPAPEFVPPCSQEVNDMYNKIWTNLLK
jgi:hypothetical protein